MDKVGLTRHSGGAEHKNEVVVGRGAVQPNGGVNGVQKNGDVNHGRKDHQGDEEEVHPDAVDFGDAEAVGDHVVRAGEGTDVSGVAVVGGEGEVSGENRE